MPAQITIDQEAYGRALAADDKIAALDFTVRAIAALMPSAKQSGDPFCAGCIWSSVIKPLARPLIGWDRGIISQVQDQEPGESTIDNRAIRGRSASYEGDRETTGNSETERWLSTSEAFDAVTEMWLSLLEEADPGNGHGVPYWLGHTIRTEIE